MSENENRNNLLGLGLLGVGLLSIKKAIDKNREQRENELFQLGRLSAYTEMIEKQFKKTDTEAK